MELDHEPIFSDLFKKFSVRNWEEQNNLDLPEPCSWYRGSEAGGPQVEVEVVAAVTRVHID